MYAKRLDFYFFLMLSMVILAIILKFRLLCLISAVHHSDCYTYIIFFMSFSIIVYYGILNIVLCAIQ